MTTARITGITVIVTMVTLFLLGATWVYAGAWDAAASREGRDVAGGILRTMSESSIRARARELPPPPPLDSAAMLTAAEHFQSMCTSCHGAPGVPRSEAGEGLMPRARELQRESAEWSEAEIFWMIRNGIRFSGMPSFRSSHTDEQMWAIARFTKRTAGMSDAEYEAIFREIMRIRGTPAPSHQH